MTTLEDNEVENMPALTIQIKQQGTLSLPSELRTKYELNEGDILTLVDLDGIFLLTPKLSTVSILADKVEQLRQREGLSVEDLIEGLDKQRQRYYEEKYS
ncbi:AbrB/MazE/SpoVT family DNA-binding domain-containing protein, partial [bacterium]|nr:AbrB/MazE/SpoVT family DNA-binding domain-containing protein [bacterium]